MLKLYNLFALAALIYCTCSDAKAVPCISYIDDINLSYKDGIWRCDHLVCPKNTFGCKIFSKNDPTVKDLIVRINICYDENNATLTSWKQTETLSPVKTIAIDVNSYIGAESVYMTSVGYNFQYVHGIFEVNEWPAVQESTRENLNGISGCTGKNASI